MDKLSSKLIPFLILLFCNSIIAQRYTLQSFYTKQKPYIHIQVQEAFRISIKTFDSDTIRLKSNADGEYAHDFIVRSDISNDTLYIKDIQQPFLTHFDDKLAAHKVTSLAIEIEVPKNASIFIRSFKSNVYLNGFYKKVEIYLDNGHCELVPFLGNANVQTINGNINLSTKNANIQTSLGSKETIINPKISLHKINLKTATGKITISKIK